MRVLAFGDVHGCHDQLMRLLKSAGVVDGNGRWATADTELIGLGDYVDRGPESRQVLDTLMRLQAEASLADSRVVCLRGNHEQVMLDAAKGEPDDLQFWAALGGVETLRSYGLTMGDFAADPRRMIPEGHWRFLEAMPYTHQANCSLFVHGGVDPTRHLDDHDDPSVFMEIRRWWHGDPGWVERNCGVRRIVFGHTPHKDVTAYLEERAIAVDTGAVYGGKLSMVEVTEDGWQVVAQS